MYAKATFPRLYSGWWMIRARCMRNVKPSFASAHINRSRMDDDAALVPFSCPTDVLLLNDSSECSCQGMEVAVGVEARRFPSSQP